MRKRRPLNPEFRPFGVFRASPAFHLYLVQAVTFFYMAWRFASRNYAVYGTLPDDQFDYPRTFMFELLPVQLVEFLSFQFIYDLGVPRPGEGALTFLQLVIIGACAAGFLGVVPRIAARIAFVLGLHFVGLMQSSNAEVDGSTLVLGALFVLAVTPRGALYNWRDGFHPLRRATAHHWPIVVLFMIVGAFYTTAGINKLVDVGPHWPAVLRLDNLADNAIERSLFAWNRFADPAIAALHHSPWLSLVGGIVTLIGEIGFITILFLPRFRWFMVISMVMLHGLVFATTGINFMGSSLILLLCVDWNTPLRTLAVYYDDRCGMCSSTVRTLRRMDWFHRLTYVPISSVADDDPIDAAQLQSTMAVRDENGALYYGADAFEQLGSRCLPLAPFALLMKVPGAIYPARRVYGRIARRRQAISCRLDLQPERPS